MKRIKQRLLSLAMTGALLLGFTLPEAFAAGAKSSNERSASEAQQNTSEKSDRKQSKKNAADAQAEEQSSKASDEAVEKSKSAEDKATGGNSEKTEEKAGSDKSEKSEEIANSSNKKVSLSLSISRPGGLSASGGVWQVDPEKVSALTLSWKCKGDCDSFEVSVSGGVYSASTEKKSAKIPVSGLSEGKYTATVKAIRDGKTVAKEKLSFQIIASSVNEASEETASESIGNDGADESAIQQTQPEEGMPAEVGDTVAAQPDSVGAETNPEGQDTRKDRPAEAVNGEPEEAEVDEAQNTSEEQPVGQSQDPEAEQPAGQSLDAGAEQPAGQSLDAGAEQPVGQPQDAEAEQSVEDSQESVLDPSTEEAQGTLAQLPMAQVQDAPEEQPDQEGNDAIEAVLIEAASDAAIDQPAGEECLDLSEPDIQTPQEDSVELQAVSEVSLPEVTADTPEEPELALSETVEAPEPINPSSEPVLPEGDSVTANAGEEKEKTDNKLILSVKGAEGLSVIDGAVHVNSAQASTVTLVWSFGGTCDEYAVSVSGGVYGKTTGKSQLKLPVKRLPSGKNTVTVAANKDGKALSSARLGFFVDDAGSEGETTGLAVTVASPQGLLITEGAYQVDPAQADALTLTWQFGGECDAYDVSISGDVYSGRTEEDAVTVPLSDLAAGTYTVTVVALRDGEAAARGQLTFNIPSQGEQPEDDPGKDGKQGGQSQGGGQRRSGQTGGAAKDGDGQEAEQGFRVTPGEALIGTHTSGNRDMRLYGAVALTLDGESAMNVLTLGDTMLDIRLSDGGLFNASVDGDTLVLIPQGEVRAWLLNGYALKTLARSGVTCLRLTLDDMTVEFPTLPELSGSNYGTLCASGRTSRDYSYAVSSNGCTVTVAGQSYLLTAEGELV